MIRQIAAVAIKELQLIWQDRPALALLFVMPAFFIIVMSLALQNVFEAGTPDRPLTVLIVDEDGGPVASELIASLERAAGIVVIQEIDGGRLDRSRAEQAIADRDYPLALVLPVGLSARASKPGSDSPTVELIADPATQRQIVAPVRGAVEGALRLARLLERLPEELGELVTEWSIEEGEAVPPPEVLEELEQDYRGRLGDLDATSWVRLETRAPRGVEAVRSPTATQQNVPAYTIFGVFFISLTLSTSFVREREHGTLTRLHATPLSRPALMLGKILPYQGVNLVQIVSMLAVGVMLFDIEVGNIAALGLLSIALASTATGLGLLVASIVRTEAQAGALAVATSLLLAALGGLMVPSDVMPGPMRALAYATPHAWALQGFHDVMLRGGGVGSVMAETAILLVFATAFFGSAAWLLRYR